MTPDPFTCRACGACCRWEGCVLLRDADVTRLAEAVGLSERSFIRRYTRLAPNRRELSLAERDDGACVFLEARRCRVYAARPRQCRDFPVRWRVEGPCPGRERGRGGA